MKGDGFLVAADYRSYVGWSQEAVAYSGFPGVVWLLLVVEKSFPCPGCGHVLPVGAFASPHEGTYQALQRQYGPVEDGLTVEWMQHFAEPDPSRSQPYCMDCWPFEIMSHAALHALIGEAEREVGERSRHPMAVPSEHRMAKAFSSTRSHRQPRRGPVPSRRSRFRPHS